MIATIFGAASFIFDYLRVMKPQLFPATETENILGKVEKRLENIEKNMNQLHPHGKSLQQIEGTLKTIHERLPILEEIGPWRQIFVSTENHQHEMAQDMKALKQEMQFCSLNMRSISSNINRIKEDGVKIRGPNGLIVSGGTKHMCKSPAESLARERIQKYFPSFASMNDVD